MHFKITAHIHTNYILYTWNSDERFTFSLNVTSLFIGMIIIYSSHSTQVAYTYSMLISCLEALELRSQRPAFVYYRSPAQE